MLKPSNLRCSLSFDKYVKEGGWCSQPFLPLTIVLVEFWQKRGVEAKFSRVGPVVTSDGEKHFLISTGFTPPSEFNMPLSDSALNYVHIIDMDGNPIFQIHRSEQEKLVLFLNDRFSHKLAQMPATEEEKNKIVNAISAGNAYGE